MQCKICNEIFKSNKDLSIHIRYKHKIQSKIYYDTYLKKENEGKCKLCGKSTKFINITQGYTICCINCRYKNKETLQKRHKTCIKKYGVINPWQRPDIIQKNLNAKLQKYGTTVVSKNKDIINKTKQTKINRIAEFEQQNNCTILNKVIADVNSYVWYFSDLHKDFKNSLIYLRKGQNVFIKNDDIPKIQEYVNDYLSSHGTSNIEQYIYNQICSFYKGIVIHRDKHVIFPKELDIYIPDLKLAIEFNGEYWHSIEAGCKKDHIIKKSIDCTNKGIRLIHIYEWENLDIQLNLLKDLINGIDNYPKQDFNKNNFLPKPKPYKIINPNVRFTVYTAGPLL